MVGRPRARVLIVSALLTTAAVGSGLLLWERVLPDGPSASGQTTQESFDALVHRRTVIGRSVRGRPVLAVALGDPDAAKKILLVGCIHGDERAGVAISRQLESSAPPSHALLWVINDLNPDGAAVNTRQNARGVDLNRNFPWRWRRLGRPGDWQYSGPRPASEPETRMARALILQARPYITIWFHQPLGLVDESGGSARIERRFARLVGLPLERLPRYPGSAAGWQNHRLGRSTAFVVELPGRPSARLLDRNADAVQSLAASLSSTAHPHVPS